MPRNGSKFGGETLHFYVIQHIFAFCGRKICVCQKLVVLLHPKSETRIENSSAGETERATLGSDPGGIAGREKHTADVRTQHVG